MARDVERFAGAVGKVGLIEGDGDLVRLEVLGVLSTSDGGCRSRRMIGPSEVPIVNNP